MTEAFEKLVSLLDYPMFVVTTRAGDEPAGCLVGFASSGEHPAAAVPRRTVETQSHLPGGRGCEPSCGPLDQSGGTANWPGCSAARPATGLTNSRGAHGIRARKGLPILDDAAGWFAGAVLSRYDVGDHVGFVLEPVAGSAPDKFEQLVTFSDVHDLDPGHEA